MPTIKTLKTMIPFLKFQAGDFYVFRLNAREIINIKGDDRDCLNVSVYFTGSMKDFGNALPSLDEILPRFKNRPMVSLLGANKAITDALYAKDAAGNVSIPDGRFFILAYEGKKNLGGKSFNQWSNPQEIEFSEAEKKELFLQ